MLRAVLLAALLLAPLAPLAPGAQALEAAVHGWSWRVFPDKAQVQDDLVVGGPGEALRLDVPASARDVQVFVNGTAAPWQWAGPTALEVTLPRNRAAGAEVAVQLRYVVPSGPSGVQAERTVTLDTREFVVGVDAPEGWAVTIDGFPREHGELGTRLAGQTVVLRVAPAGGPSPLPALAGLLLLVLAAVLVRGARAKGRAVPESMGLLDHLRELQGHLKAIIVAVGALMLFVFSFTVVPLGTLPLAVPVPSFTDNLAAQTFRLVAQQFVPPGVSLVVFSPVTGALVQVEVALVLAVLLATPLIAYEVGAFLTPALLPHERRVVLRAVPVATGLFLAGALFAYVVMVPVMMRVLYSYAEGLGAGLLLGVDSLVSFAIIVTLVFGLAFELPLGMVALAKLGVVTPQAMAAKWRHAVMAVFILAAVITPDPSVVSQLLVAIPLLGLYVLGLVASRAVVGASAAESAASAA